MARTARLVVPDMSVHIVQRGHDGRDCFFEERDYIAYLDLLAQFAPRSGCSVHAYCLMTNHVHLFVTPHAAESCALLMKNVGQRYVQAVNKRRGRSGTLWEGRFYSCLVPTERYALACYRYVERNPIKPAMAGHPSEYPWSSYRTNVCGAWAGFVTPHPAYLALGEDDGRRAAAYRAMCDVPVSNELVEDLRRATRRGHVAGTPPRTRGRPWQMRKMGSVPN
jgi:putative transposase